MSLLIQIGQVCASDVATQTRDFDPIITRKSGTLESPQRAQRQGNETENVVVSLEITCGAASASTFVLWLENNNSPYLFRCALLLLFGFLGLQQLKEKPHDFSGLCKDSSSKSCSRDTASLDPDVRLCQCVENTIIEIINMSVSGI